MSNLNNKEKRFKEILEDVSFDLDTSALWDDIKDDLPVKKRKKSRPIWYLLFAFFFTACVPALLLYSFSSSEASSTTKEVIPFNTAISTTSVETASDNNVPVEPKTTNNISEINATSNLDNSSDNGKNLLSNGEIENKESANVTLFSSDINTAETKNLVPQNDSPADIEEINETTGLDNTTSNITLSKLLFTSINTPISGIAFESDRTFENPLEEVMIEPFEEVANRFRTSLIMRSGMNKSLVSNTLVSDASEFDPSLFQYEKELYGQSHYVGIAMDNPKGWSWSLGFGYNSFNSSFRRSDITSDSTMFQAAQGGSITRKETTYHNVNWHRRHKSYNVQLSLAKELVAFKNLSLNGEIAIAYSVSSSNSGYYFGENVQTIVRFEDGEDAPYKNSYGLIMQPGFTVNYNLNRVGVGLHTFYAHTINSITKDNNFYKTNNALLGVQLQLAYRL